MLFLGLALILIGGIFQGTFYLPMTYTRKWEWEHTWFVFAFSGMIVFSWIFILFTVPGVFSIYQTVPLKDILILQAFGVLWGVGGVLNGLAMASLGMALAYPIVIGTVASLGALIPLVVFFPEALLSAKGMAIIAGTVVTVMGIITCSKAFALKEPGTQTAQRGSLAGKLAIAVSAGVMSSLLNIGFAFSSGMIKNAVESGVPETLAANTAWALILTTGGLVNIIYTFYLMFKRKTGGGFFGPETGRNLMLGLLMGFLWCAGLYVYGFGAASMGKLGVVVGWVIFMVSVIIVGNIVGIWRGEWKDATAKARTMLNRGLVILIIAIIIVALSNNL